MNSLFESGIVTRDSATGSLFYSCLDYKTNRHELVSEDSVAEINRLGIILAAKSTKTYILTARASFGDADGDTSMIDYTANIYVVTNGGSGFVSVANAFSQQQNNIIQGDPNSSINKEEATGKIHMKDHVADFAYKMEFKSGKLKPTGKFIYNNDTLMINAVNETIKKGKVKKAGFVSMTPGIQLQKGETIYAALDIVTNKKKIYLASRLPKAEKLMLASFFFILCSYSDDFF